MNRLQRIWDDGAIELDVELPLDSFALGGCMLRPAGGSERKVPQGVFATNKSERHCLPLFHPPGAAESRRINGEDTGSHVVGGHRRELSIFLLPEIVYSQGVSGGSGEELFAAIMEDIQRAYDILLRGLPRVGVGGGSGAELSNTLAEAVWLGGEQRDLAVMPACDDGSSTTVFDDFDTRHIIISNSETGILAIQPVPGRLGRTARPLTLSTAADKILSRAPHNELLLAGRVKVSVDNRHEEAPSGYAMLPSVPARLDMRKQGLKLKGPLVPAPALPGHGLGQLRPCVGSCGRSRRGKRRKAVPDKDAPPIVADEVVKAAAGQGQRPEVAGAFEAGKHQEEDVVG